MKREGLEIFEQKFVVMLPSFSLSRPSFEMVVLFQEQGFDVYELLNRFSAFVMRMPVGNLVIAVQRDVLVFLIDMVVIVILLVSLVFFSLLKTILNFLMILKSWLLRLIVCMLSSDHEIKKPYRLNIHVDISKKEHHHPANDEQGIQQPADVP